MVEIDDQTIICLGVGIRLTIIDEALHQALRLYLINLLVGYEFALAILNSHGCYLEVVYFELVCMLLKH